MCSVLSRIPFTVFRLVSIPKIGTPLSATGPEDRVWQTHPTGIPRRELCSEGVVHGGPSLILLLVDLVREIEVSKKDFFFFLTFGIMFFSL